MHFVVREIVVFCNFGAKEPTNDFNVLIGSSRPRSVDDENFLHMAFLRFGHKFGLHGFGLVFIREPGLRADGLLRQRFVGCPDEL